ncbi:putative thioesterase [Frankia sp. QA3]|nr:putative thioesterase [Frankia sp. QA3]
MRDCLHEDTIDPAGVHSGGMDPRRDPERLSLASYPLSHPVQARFSDLDGNGHLNNVALASFYEDARITLDWRIFTDGKPVPFEGFTFVVANISIHYLAEAHYPATYVVGCGVGRIGTSSFVHSAGLFRDGVCLGLCDSILVHLVNGAPTVIPPHRRAQMEALAFPVRAGGASSEADGGTAAIPGQPAESGSGLVGSESDRR